MNLKSQLRAHHSKVRGVTYGNGQKPLKRLSCYEEEEIKLIACREYDNPYNRNTIEISASVNGNRACLGYFGKLLAEPLAAMIDDGAWMLPILREYNRWWKGTGPRLKLFLRNSYIRKTVYIKQTAKTFRTALALSISVLPSFFCIIYYLYHILFNCLQ
ncbi:MAG: hypothetical protein KAH14_00860 [Clostridiales bacterium]|nr:hypothetical protein [Clostridiales bacterium]